METAARQTSYFRTAPVLPAIFLLLFFPMVILPQPLIYEVAWLGVPVVDVTIDSRADEWGDYTEYQAQTRVWFDRIYSVDNRYRIWVNDVSGQPLRYEKQIHERGVRDSLKARYDLENTHRVIYSNGAERPWTPEGQTFFSALIWMQHHDWEIQEKRVQQVEVEGVMWEVELACLNSAHSDAGSSDVVEISVHFSERLEGEPVLATTDVLTYMLPGEDHQLRFALDVEHDLILWVEFGSWPFIVRAELISDYNSP
ncbi:DUF3108 domain-containing protein [Candidatus Neomarinimicrobiota bacterium]